AGACRAALGLQGLALGAFGRRRARRPACLRLGLALFPSLEILDLATGIHPAPDPAQDKGAGVGMKAVEVLRGEYRQGPLAAHSLPIFLGVLAGVHASSTWPQ